MQLTQLNSVFRTTNNHRRQLRSVVEGVYSDATQLSCAAISGASACFYWFSRHVENLNVIS